MLNLDEQLMRSVVLSSATYVANGGVGLIVVGGLVGLLVLLLCWLNITGS